ncbi:calcium-translocating P-type ATPase, PMCA-type [Nitrosococcus wardiae]|uniref:P-type Ca(2+) transporter n=1 Tax=Nitrosococcus wardiae TaxID=1814290 RepID=A0A4P7BYU0_9GAMM|nr:calcium-translocating P-type ATPase, PMCA-type [Nitrosococcus wardiae]QBQ55251.1 calcium-translocating P-type ATPase, PMCA-type [Nitrosococcus wardiae]
MMTQPLGGMDRSQDDPGDLPWHTLSASEAAKHLQVDPKAGLSSAAVAARLEQYGPNRLREKPGRSAWRLFQEQFKSLLVMVLLGAAGLAGAVGDLKDAVVILVVVLFNALLGFYQEHRAEATLAALKKMLAQTARVRRNNQIQEIPAEELVPGDRVLLEAGDRVPADGRIMAAHSLEINEATLTGESQTVAKTAEALAPADIPLAERINMAYMNTVVTRGRLELLVTATGMATEMGRLTGMLEEAEENPTPLQIQLDQLGRRLAIIAGGVVSLIFVLGLLRDQPLVDTIMTSIALAVAAIPEGLPAVVTVTLALGMHRMAKHRAIIKRLAAVETLGSTTVICSDKTGTLTLNQMTARAVFFQGQSFTVSGEGYSTAGQIAARDSQSLLDLTPLLIPAALCNDSRLQADQLIGDPTEGALLVLAAKGGIEAETLTRRLPRIAEIPFDSATKLMATFHQEGNQVHLLVKGAPDVLLERSARWLKVEGETPLTENTRNQLNAENEALAAQAMRVLAIASRRLPMQDFAPGQDLMTYVQDLTFIGLVGIIDPPRPEARDAIQLCHRAGITVKMITGDHKATAGAIAQELNLSGEVITGTELDQIDVGQLAERIKQVAVFARVAPEHKVKIIQALKAHGHVVAMTGDGVNDAPALKNADIGVAMGVTGTEVTKEAATMVLTDDNFATIVGAVKEGRTIYDNIVKFVRFQLSTNIGAILTVASAPLLGLPTPFTAIQILWINIIMDGPPAMSLGVEPPRPNLMDEAPRRRGMPILTLGRLRRLLFYGAIMAIGTLGMFYYSLPEGSEYALTLAFTTFVLFQFFNVFNARVEVGSAFTRQFFRNSKLWLALLAVIVLQGVVVHWEPAQAIFHTTDLSLQDWGLAFAIAASVLLLEEARKFFMQLKRREEKAPPRRVKAPVPAFERFKSWGVWPAALIVLLLGVGVGSWVWVQREGEKEQARVVAEAERQTPLPAEPLPDMPSPKVKTPSERTPTPAPQPPETAQIPRPEEEQEAPERPDVAPQPPTREAPEQAEVSPAAKTVVVQPGDTLSQIAARAYGDPNQWPLIYEANRDKIKNPNVITPGMELTLPLLPKNSNS